MWRQHKSFINSNRINKSNKNHDWKHKQYLTKPLSERNIIRLCENASDIKLKKKIAKDPHILRYIKNLSYQLCYFAILKDPHVIKYLEDPPYELQYLAILKDPHTIKYSISNNNNNLNGKLI